VLTETKSTSVNTRKNFLIFLLLSDFMLDVFHKYKEIYIQ